MPLPSLLLPQERVFEEAANCAHRRLDDSHPAIQKPTTQEILPTKVRCGTQRQITPPRAPPPRCEGTRTHPRVRDELLHVMAQVAVRRVIQLLREGSDVAE